MKSKTTIKKFKENSDFFVKPNANDIMDEEEIGTTTTN